MQVKEELLCNSFKCTCTHAIVACVRVLQYALTTVVFERSEKCLLHDLFHSRLFLSVDLQSKSKNERQ